MDNFDDIFNANKPSENEAVTETTVDPVQEQEAEEVTETVEQPTETDEQEVEQETAEQKAQQPRDEKGRFAQKQEQSDTIPLSALVAERKNYQAQLQAERERAAEYERQLQAYQQQQQRSQRPDPFDNPDEYDAYLQAAIDARVEAKAAQLREQEKLQSFHSSHQKAAEAFGQEAVAEALNWAQQRAATDDAWGRTALAQPDPVRFIVEQRNTHAQYEEFLRDPDGFKARLLAEQSAAAAANATAQHATKMAAKVQAPRSLSGQTSGTPARPTAQTEGEAFNAIFDSQR